MIHVALDASYILASFYLRADDRVGGEIILLIHALFETQEFHRICARISHTSVQFYRKNIEIEKKFSCFKQDLNTSGVADCWKRNE